MIPFLMLLAARPTSGQPRVPPRPPPPLPLSVSVHTKTAPGGPVDSIPYASCCAAHVGDASRTSTRPAAAPAEHLGRHQDGGGGGARHHFARSSPAGEAPRRRHPARREAADPLAGAEPA